MSVDRLRLNKLLTAARVTVTFAPSLTSAQIAGNPVAPRRDLVEAVVREAHARLKNDTQGKNADYIPYLAQV